MKRWRKILNKEEVEKITKEIEKDFPDDLALQQVHIARKIIAKEAELKGLKYLDYIKLINDELNQNKPLKTA